MKVMLSNVTCPLCSMAYYLAEVDGVQVLRHPKQNGDCPNKTKNLKLIEFDAEEA